MWELSVAETMGQKEQRLPEIACFERVSYETFTESFLLHGYGDSSKARDAFAQAVFVPYGIAVGSSSSTKRKGGIGSTDNT